MIPAQNLDQPSVGKAGAARALLANDDEAGIGGHNY